MLNHGQWINSRRRLLKQVKTQVEVRLGMPEPDLRRYAAALQGEFRGAWNACSQGAFGKALRGADIVLASDFHAYAQAQRAHLRILREMVSHSTIVLALECLRPKDENAVELYFSGEISESEFLSQVGWNKNWGFPWENYRPLFEFARTNGLKVVGVNRPEIGDLEKRDDIVAKRILELANSHSGAKIFVVIGEWHLAARHLPLCIRQSSDFRVITLFQDAEPLFFRLARHRREGRVDILRASKDRYCLMVSPPWMKWQSYLIYLEHAYDHDLDDQVGIDYSDHVAGFVEILAKDLKLKIPKERIQVYGPASKQSLNRIGKWMNPREMRVLQYHLEHDLSFFLPERDWLYLSRSSINHASTLAGQYIHGHLANRKTVKWDMPADFLSLIWIEAVGFFLSKWINPRRKPDSLENIRIQLGATYPKDSGREALLLALDTRLYEVVFIKTGRRRTKRFRARRLSSYIEASRILGSMLGERLFWRVREGVIRRGEVHKLLFQELDGPKFEEFYWQIVRRVEDLEGDRGV